MAIYKAEVDSNYTVIPNETARNTSLSFEARGMLAMLLSLPSDWQVNTSWLQSQSSAGRDKVNSILKELIEHGYMAKQQPKNQRGQFTQNDFFVYSTPVDGFAVDGLPSYGKTPTTKERVLQKKDNTNSANQNSILADQVIDMYNTVKATEKPNWIGVESKTVDRVAKTKKFIAFAQKRIGSKDHVATLQWFTDYFIALSKDDFYSGRPSPRNNEGFLWKFDSLIREKNYVPAIEKFNDE